LKFNDYNFTIKDHELFIKKLYHEILEPEEINQIIERKVLEVINDIERKMKK